MRFTSYSYHRIANPDISGNNVHLNSSDRTLCKLVHAYMITNFKKVHRINKPHIFLRQNLILKLTYIILAVKTSISLSVCGVVPL